MSLVVGVHLACNGQLQQVRRLPQAQLAPTLSASADVDCS